MTLTDDLEEEIKELTKGPFASEVCLKPDAKNAPCRIPHDTARRTKFGELTHGLLFFFESTLEDLINGRY